MEDCLVYEVVYRVDEHDKINIEFQLPQTLAVGKYLITQTVTKKERKKRLDFTCSFTEESNFPVRASQYDAHPLSNVVKI